MGMPHDDHRPEPAQLVAQALVEDLDLVIGHEILLSYPIGTIW